MTKISYIHGIGQRKDLPKAVAQARAINYQRMTRGEMRLALMAEQLNILGSWYGDEEFKKGEQKLINTLRRGLHGATDPGSIGANTNPVMQMVAREIKKARQLRNPAASVLVRSISTGINDPLVPMKDCSKVFDEAMKLDLPTVEKYKNAARLVDECVRQNNESKLINENLESGAHHLLYEFLTGTQGSTRAQTKSVLHRNAISSLADITHLDRDNLRLWIRNGVMRKNTEFGADPLQPEQTISVLKNAWQKEENIGEIFTGIAAVISAIASAVGATLALLGALDQAKRQQIQSAAAGIGTPTFGPEESDWSGGGATGSGDSLLPIGAAVAAYLMLS